MNSAGDEEMEATLSGVRVVELTVEAVEERIAVVRNLVEAVLLTDDFPLDTVADLKLGIDEVCTQLITAAAPRSRLHVVVSTGPDYARIEVCCDLRPEGRLDESGFGWFVIGSVTDSAGISYVDGAHGTEARATLTALRD